MKRAVAILASTVVVIACSSTAPQADPAFVPPEPKVVTDPRVSELRIIVLELVDRMEVMQARLNRMEDVLTELADGARTGAATGPVVTPDDQAAVRRYVSASEAADSYREAMTLFARGANSDARSRFQGVYEADPRGELADNALYWIGETYFVMNDLRKAISYYEQVLEHFPSQNKAPDALHRKAIALAKLGDLSLARTTLETLIRQYPHSTAAAAAKTELERIRY